MRARYRFFFLAQIFSAAVSALLGIAVQSFFGVFPRLVSGVWIVLGAFNLLYMWVYVPLLWRASRYDFDGKTLVITRGLIIKRIQHIDIKAIQYVTHVRLPYTEKDALSLLHTIGGVVIIFC